MRIIKALFANTLLFAVLITMLAVPISFMGVARFSDLPVLGTTDEQIEYDPYPDQPYEPLSGKTKRYYELKDKSLWEQKQQTSSEPENLQIEGEVIETSTTEPSLSE